MIRDVEKSDSAAIARIYNHYIKNTIITFEEAEVTPDEISGRIEKLLSASLPWLVAEEKGSVLGYVYAGKWRGRSAYRFSVESTVYVAPASKGRGIGSLLYRELLSMLEQAGIHAVMGGGLHCLIPRALPYTRNLVLKKWLNSKKREPSSENG